MVMPSLLTPVSSDPLQDDLMAAEAAVRAYCGWHIAPAISEDLVLDGSGTRSLLLRTLHLKDVTSVSVLGVAEDVTGLEWSESGYLRRRCVWPDRLRSVKLTAVHGFDSVPDVVAIIRAVAARASASPAGVVREQAGQVSLSFSMVASGVSGGVVLMDHERRMLDAYRLPGRV